MSGRRHDARRLRLDAGIEFGEGVVVRVVISLGSGPDGIVLKEHEKDSQGSRVTRFPCYTGQVANLTLTIDDELLKRARVRAVRENTSVNAIVRQYLESYAGAEAMASARARLVELSQTTSSGSGPGGRSWGRDDLHAR